MNYNKNAKDKLRKQFPNAIIQPVTLRVDRKLEASDILRFDPRSNKTGINNSEILISQSDFFVGTDLAIAMKVVVSDRHDISSYETFPNETVFVAATGFVPSHLNAIYHGKLTLKTGTTNHIEDYSCLPFLKVPERQGGEVTAALSGPATYTIAKSPFNLNGLFNEIGGMVSMAGNGKHEITIDCPIDGTIQYANTNANTDNYVTMFIRGWIARNVIA